MADSASAAPHSGEEILTLATKIFADLDFGKSPKYTVRSLPLFRMTWDGEEPVVVPLGWRYLLVVHSRESFAIDALASEDSGFRFLFRRGAGRVWQDAIQRLYRRQQIKSKRFELRCLDVPVIHQSFLWLSSENGDDLLLKIQDHGEILQRRKLHSLKNVQREMQLALRRKIAGSARTREAAGK